jgi:hypothetical protein
MNEAYLDAFLGWTFFHAIVMALDVFSEHEGETFNKIMKTFGGWAFTGWMLWFGYNNLFLAVNTIEYSATVLAFLWVKYTTQDAQLREKLDTFPIGYMVRILVVAMCYKATLG